MATTTSAWAPVTSDAYSTPTANSVPDSSYTSSQSDDRSFGDLYQNYFAFVAVVIVIALVGGCVFYRRKKRIIYRASVSRQLALSRDIEDQGLRANRGWGWGALSRDYSSGPTPRGQPLSARAGIGLAPWRRRREEEGLNEAGEAPPAYKPAPDDNDTVLETGQPAPQNDATTPAVPRPTLGREHTGLKPPDYTEAVVAPVRGSSSMTVPTSSAANPTTITNEADPECGDLPGYVANTHERR
ncbi:unnamed protein product [Aureobasidium pullulans]|nr:MAG: Uncharacterized protein AUREO_015700 [Aureobasidium pullulans]THW61609.1 hypothetical protein D6D25_02416 [Aureobasidium pullulans]TIA50582.1 hypothetical protein D6C79_02989 [Aureobasidium pullulans]CAD0024413.1 unnamed protein product [Aureobasidium pullulans]CAD0045715.1 unnamed protein product [Aureobasidium pullulans]